MLSKSVCIFPAPCTETFFAKQRHFIIYLLKCLDIISSHRSRQCIRLPVTKALVRHLSLHVPSSFCVQIFIRYLYGITALEQILALTVP